MSFDSFFDSYLESALASSNDWSDMVGDNPQPLDKKYYVGDFAKTTKAYLKKDAKAFYDTNRHLWEVDNDDEHAGHDFWMTRNHSGVGFWDGDYERGDELTEAAHKYRELDLYASRGRIHADGEPVRKRKTKHGSTR